MESHIGWRKHANGEEIGNSELLANEVFVRLEMLVRNLTVTVQDS